MKLVAKKKEFGGKLFGPGLHMVTIKSIVPENPSNTEFPWVDKTPQLKAVLRNENGFITVWFNLKGYKNASDFPDGIAPKGHEFVSSNKGNEEYLMNSKTKERVESAERTEKALAGIMDIAAQSGIEGEFEIEDLIDRQVGVMVRELNGKVEAHYFVPYEVEEEVTA